MSANRRNRAISALVAAGLVASAMAQVQHGKLDVVELNGGNDPNSIAVTRLGGYGVWDYFAQDPNAGEQSSRGDYFLDFGTGNDYNLGVLIVGAYEDERMEPSVTEPDDPNDPNGPSHMVPYVATFAASRATSSGAGHFYVSAFRSPTGHEVNANPALAYFPIADGWYCGSAYNLVNGGPITEFIGHPDFVLTGPSYDPNWASYPTAFIDNINMPEAGNFGLRIAGIDMRRDGVLLACGAKNEDNYTAVFINYDGTAILNNRDNGDNATGKEQDPTAFCFIPDGTVGVTMGRISGTGRTIYGQGDFTVTMEGAPATNGTYRLSIAGEGPDTGTLIVTPYTAIISGPYNIDNPVFAEPQPDGTWLIKSRDIPGMGLQDIPAWEVAFHFAFFKDGVDIVPGTPSKWYESEMDKVVSGRVSVTEISPGNGNGEMFADWTGSSNMGIAGDNRGDIAIKWLDARLQSRIDSGRDNEDGVFLGNTTEFVRDNTPTGGTVGWGTLSFDNGQARTHAAVPTGGEFNINFALAFFPNGAGFQQHAESRVYQGSSDLVQIDGDPVTDGVLLAINWDNNNRYITATPTANPGDPNANGYLIECFEGIDGSPTVADPGDPNDPNNVPVTWDYGYVYLPYNTQDLIAGQIDNAGNVISGTGNFTVGLSTDEAYGFPITTITIPGVDAASDGVLVVTATEPGLAMAWEPGPNGEFEVAGFDPLTQSAGRAAFAFAYVDYDSTLHAPSQTPGDIDGDGDVDLSDLAILLAAYGTCDGDANYNADADLNGDDCIDLSDLAILLANYGFGT